MTETGPSSVATGSGLLGALASVAGDRSGIETFARYVWQAKQAVRLWLTCLPNGGPELVICEHVEDLTLLYQDRIRFLQLKTRDRGSWSATIMCSHGLDSLLRSYAAARAVGLHERSSFELWLEGPSADSADTIAFERNPPAASVGLRRKMLTLGAEQAWLDDFLERLVVRPNQPTRAYIDSVALREIGAIWPSLSTPEMVNLYEGLLKVAIAAQAADRPVDPIHAQLAAAMSSPAISPETLGTAPPLQAIGAQILDRDAIAALTPPPPGESVAQLLARISDGSTSSMLELKMQAAGASTATIRQVQDLRAEAEVRRQLLLASRDTVESDLEELAHRTLLVAEATARRLGMTAISNPAIAARPGDALVAELMSRPSDLGGLDRAQLFNGDGLAILGFLGHLSDECRFPWRAA